MTTDTSALLRRLRTAVDALDPAAQPLAIFVRDDDAGWDDSRLARLLDVTADAGVPIDLAAIPLAVGDELAAALCSRVDAEPGRIGIHQHGLVHRNHQREGRSSEFGSDRDAQAQRSDLIHGREVLRQRFGHRLDPFFTPPWNRCAPYTPALLADLGFATLSRDRGATPQCDLAELPVDVDWSKHHRSGAAAAVIDALAIACAVHHDGQRPLGLMLHHAAMSDAEFELLRGCLGILAGHASVRFVPMRSAAAVAPQVARARTRA